MQGICNILMLVPRHYVFLHCLFIFFASSLLVKYCLFLRPSVRYGYPATYSPDKLLTHQPILCTPDLNLPPQSPGVFNGNVLARLKVFTKTLEIVAHIFLLESDFSPRVLQTRRAHQLRRASWICQTLSPVLGYSLICLAWILWISAYCKRRDCCCTLNAWMSELNI